MPNDKETVVPGTLKLGEPHPLTQVAYQYIASIPSDRLMDYLANYSSSAMSGNRLGEVCGETLRRLLHNEIISDRYLLGLEWSLKELEKSHDK